MPTFVPWAGVGGRSSSVPRSLVSREKLVPADSTERFATLSCWLTATNEGRCGVFVLSIREISVLSVFLVLARGGNESWVSGGGGRSESGWTAPFEIETTFWGVSLPRRTRTCATR